jgi:hypothetical protein
MDSSSKNVGSQRPPAASPADRPDAIETVHRFDRPGDDSPLFVLSVVDREGRLLAVAAYDPEDYS